MTMALTHLDRLEGEAIHILRESFAEARRPVLLFSGGKDSTVLAYLAAAAFYPGRPPMPLLHIDSTFEFQETLEFRDHLAEELGFELIVRRNEEGLREGVSPFVHGSALYTDIMRTTPLKAALDELGADIIFGGARRDEEKARAKERVVSVRSPNHVWEPRAQRPELWRLYNAKLVVADDRYPFAAGEQVETRTVRFRTVGCWPVTGAIESQATTLSEVMRETIIASTSERQGRLIDTDEGSSLESKKRQGYF